MALRLLWPNRPNILGLAATPYRISREPPKGLPKD